MTALVSRPREVVPSLEFMPSHSNDKRRSCLSPRDFEVFVREYTPRLLGIAYRFLRSEEDAADAVQDGLLAAFASRESFQGNSTVYTWLYRIVVNVCLMKIRSRPRVQSTTIDELTLSDEACGRWDHSDSVSRNDAPNGLELDETRATIRACIDRLPAEYREILLLRDIQELDTSQTARLLNVSRSAVKTRLHRARQALRLLLQPVVA